MLTIVCGEDIGTARNQFLKLKDDYKKKGFSLQDIDTTSLPDLYKNSQGVVDLFGRQSVYVTNNLSAQYKGRTKTEMKDIIQKISTDTDFHILDWESGKSAYDLATIKKITSGFYEFKLSKSIFELLDSTYPGNLKSFLSTLDIISASQDIIFIYTLLWRHVRKLILARNNIFDNKTQPWQRGRITAQAKTWKEHALLNFYNGLIRIDHGMKTGSSTFDVKESIEILGCYYLK
jgi:hypothetical protein